MRRIEPEEALNQWNRDSQGLIKEIGLIDSMRRGHATHNATFKVVASLTLLCYEHKIYKTKTKITKYTCTNTYSQSSWVIHHIDEWEEYW